MSDDRDDDNTPVVVATIAVTPSLPDGATSNSTINLDFKTSAIRDYFRIVPERAGKSTVLRVIMWPNGVPGEADAKRDDDSTPPDGATIN